MHISLLGRCRRASSCICTVSAPARSDHCIDWHSDSRRRREKRREESSGLRRVGEHGFFKTGRRFWASLQQLWSPAGRLKEAPVHRVKYSSGPSGCGRGGAHAAVTLRILSHPTPGAPTQQPHRSPTHPTMTAARVLEAGLKERSNCR